MNRACSFEYQQKDSNSHVVSDMHATHDTTHHKWLRIKLWADILCAWEAFLFVHLWFFLKQWEITDRHENVVGSLLPPLCIHRQAPLLPWKLGRQGLMQAGRRLWQSFGCRGAHGCSWAHALPLYEWENFGFHLQFWQFRIYRAIF